MLDRDPNADQPPDPSLLRSRSRSHKPKNAPKKQPQRGLGVAQLEKLRLEEQSKQQEAVCLASLQLQSLHHHHHHHHHHHNHFIQFQQQDQQAPHLLYPHQNFLHPNHQSPQTSPLCLSRHIKHMETSYDKSSFGEPRLPLPFVKFNLVQNGFLPLTAMASKAHTRPLPLLIPQQQLPAEDEASTSPMSQVHDLCSPATTYMRPSSAESRLSPLLKGPSPASLVDKSWLNHLYDREPNKEKDSQIMHLSSSCCNSDGKKQGQDYSVVAAVNAGSTNFHGEDGGLHIPTRKLYMQNEGSEVPLSDVCLRSHLVGTFDVHIPSRTHLESPLLGAVSDGVQMKELSSFQNISLCPTWSPVDKALNRKRSWACTQEVAGPAEAFKGVDLNTSVDEVESEVTELNRNISLPFAIRDDWNNLPGANTEKSSENECMGLLPDKAVNQYDLTKVEKPLLDPCLNGAAFLSLRKQNISLKKWEVQTSGDFLTLGPSPSSFQKLTNVHFGLGNCSDCPVSKSLGKDGIPWHSQHAPFEQVSTACISSLSQTVDNNELSLEYQPSFLHTTLQRKVGFSDFFACNKVEAFLQESSTNDSLDLELRLSI